MENKIRFGERLLLLLAFLFLFFEVFSGALRYYLAIFGVEKLIYVPKILVSVFLLGEIIRSFYKLRIRRLIAFVVVCLVLYGFVGVLYNRNPIQVLFGIYGMLPLLLGVMILSCVQKLNERLVPYFLLIWVSAALGVFIDYLYEVPWEGFEYSVGGVDVTASRQWWAFGVDRVSGFSRASYEVASQLLFVGICLVCLSRSRTLILVIWILTGILISLTTTKKTVGVYFLFTFLLPIITRNELFFGFKFYVGRIIPWLVLFVGVLLPVSTLAIDYTLDLNDPVSLFLFASFEDRLISTWPNVFDFLSKHGSLFLGRGIGGIGAAQRYFEEELYISADNLYLQLYVVFGLLAIFIMVSYVFVVSNILDRKDRFSVMIWSLAVAVLVQGWAASGMDSAFMSVVIGLTWAYAVRTRSAESLGKGI